VVYEVPPPGISETQRAKFLQVRAATDAMMKLAKKYHVKLGFGTDLVFGLQQLARQNREFTLRARWFSPLEILRQVTSGNAELLAMSGRRNPYPASSGSLKRARMRTSCSSTASRCKTSRSWSIRMWRSP